MYVDSCLFWEGTVLLSNSLIPQIREILDFRARSADAIGFSFLNIIPNVFHPRHDRTPYFFKNFSGDWICTFDPGGQGSFDFAR